MASRWTNALLDEARTEGDPVADAAIDELFREGQVEAVNQLMRTLVVNDGLPSEKLPAAIRDYLSRTAAPAGIESPDMTLAQEVFGVMGPEILAVLGFYSLPADYAAKKGVQVLYRTGRLLTNPTRRVFETTQMVVDVMAPGGLGPNGRGLRSAQKVRLMHAAVRHLLKNDPRQPWDLQLGTPINQEDLAGTLMSFSFVLLDGLERLGAELAQEDREAYFRAWMAIGRIMGVKDELIPETLEECRELTQLIHERQIAGSPEGAALAKALLEGYRGLMPWLLKGAPLSTIHFFLDSDPFTGQNVAELLGLPPADWTRHLVKLVAWFERLFGKRNVHPSLEDQVLSYVSRHLIEGFLLVERGGQRAPFLIPDSLQQRWGIKAARS